MCILSRTAMDALLFFSYNRYRFAQRSPYFDTTCFYKGFVKGELYLNVIHIAFKFILYMGVLT